MKRPLSLLGTLLLLIPVTSLAHPSLDDLPNELLSEVYSYLPARDLRKIPFISKRHKKFSESKSDFLFNRIAWAKSHKTFSSNPQNNLNPAKYPSFYGPDGFFSRNGVWYLATQNGLAISKDEGKTFQTRTSSNGLPSNRVNDVFVSVNRIHIATQNGYAYSDNGGQTFKKPQSSKTPIGRTHSVATQGSRVFVGTDEGLLISEDQGETFPQWIRLGPVRKVSAFFDIVIADPPNPTWPTHISFDGGKNFESGASLQDFKTAIEILKDHSNLEKLDGPFGWSILGIPIGSLFPSIQKEFPNWVNEVSCDRLIGNQNLIALQCLYGTVLISQDWGESFELIETEMEKAFLAESQLILTGSSELEHIDLKERQTERIPLPTNAQGSITKITTRGNKVAVVSANSVYFSNDSGMTFQRFAVPQARKSGNLQSILFSGSNLYASSWTELFKQALPSGKFIKISLPNLEREHVQSFDVQGKSTFVATSNSIHILQEDSLSYRRVDFRSISTFPIVQVKALGRYLYVATTHELFLFDDQSQTSILLHSVPYPYGKLLSFNFDRGRFYLLTENALLRSTPTGGLYPIVQNKNYSVSLRDFGISRNLIWVMGAKKLFLLKKGSTQILQFNEQDGLPSGDLRTLSVNDEKVFVGTTFGLGEGNLLDFDLFDPPLEPAAAGQ